MFKKFLVLILFTSFILASPPKETIEMLSWEGDSCLTPINTNNFAYNYYSNWATFTPDNKIYAVWHREPNLVIMKWWNQRGSWSKEETASYGNISFFYSQNVSISGDSNNNLHFVWRGRPISPAIWWIFYRAKLANGTWTDICSIPRLSTGGIGYPKIAGGKGDTAHIVFYHSGIGGGQRLIYVKIYPNYPTPEIIDIDTISPMEWTGGSYYCHIAVDGENRIHVVWYANLPINQSNYNVFYRMKDPTTGLWSQVETLSLEITNTCNSLHPRVAIDGNGNIHTVWYAYNFIRGECSHIAHRVKTSSGWSEITLFPISPNYYFYYPTCAVDSLNNLHIVYYTDSASIGIYSNVYHLTRKPNGNWEGPDTITRFSEGTRFSSEIVTTRDGNLHLFRMDNASYTNNYYWIYYKRSRPTIGIKEESFSQLITKKSLISYSLSKESNVSIVIYNPSGQIVKQVYIKRQKPGIYSFAIPSNKLSKGIYFLKFETKDYKVKRKFILM